MSKCGGSGRDTTTVHTPGVAEASPSSTGVLIEGQAATAYSDEAIAATKRYAGFFSSVVSASFWSICFHPSPHPTTVKLLGRDGNATIICSYTPHGMKNAYCQLVEECGSDPAEYLSKFKDKTLSARNYFEEGFATPSVMFKA